MPSITTGAFPPVVAKSTALAQTASIRPSILRSRFAALLACQLAALPAGEGTSRAKAAGALSVIGHSPAIPLQAPVTPTLPITGSMNLLLPDPMSAYRMMSEINAREATYKAQSSELHAMRATLQELAGSGRAVQQSIDEATAPEIRARLAAFVTTYNAWVQRFGGTIAHGGMLEGTQAAELSLHELEQCLQNRFHGAAAGLKGLGEIGLTIDPATGLARFDAARFDVQASRSLDAVRRVVSDFSLGFTKMADTLARPGGFVANRLTNLDRALAFIDSHRSAWQSEFGSGDAPRLSAPQQAALAAYSRRAPGTGGG